MKEIIYIYINGACMKIIFSGSLIHRRKNVLHGQAKSIYGD